jgi:hypothetical protein
MDCVELDENGEVIPGFSDGINGGVAVPLGASVRCTAINVAATLGLRKVVVNNSGGTAVPADWELTATPIGNVPPGVGPVTVTGTDALLGELFTIRPNTEYQLTETDVPGYVLESLSCFLVPRQSGGNIISIDPLDTSVCTFTNADEPAQLTLVKVVDNGTTGRTAVPSDWTLSADGPTPVSGPGNSPDVTDQPVDPGSYELSEEGPAGYSASAWDCEGGTLTGSTVEVPPATDVTCMITNTAQNTPRIRTITSEDRVTPGTPFRDRVRLRGLAPGSRVTVTARLYGPFTSRAAARCGQQFVARSVTWRAGNGWSRSPVVRVNQTGVYTWRVSTEATAANEPGTHPCGLAGETTIVARPPFVAPIVNGGFSGTLPGHDARRTILPVIKAPGFGLRAPVIPGGVTSGRMRLPASVHTVAWLRKSAWYGDKIGTTVVAGHVSDRHDRPGAMWDLRRARRGQPVTVVTGAKTIRYRVISKATFPRGQRLPHRFFETTGPRRLVLFSCTDKVVFPNGRFHYTKYQVVTAKFIWAKKTR